MIPKVIRWSSKDTDREYEFRPEVVNEEPTDETSAKRQNIIDVLDSGELLTRANEGMAWERVMVGSIDDCMKHIETTEAGKWTKKEF